jgi:hypothetical protein
MSNTKSCLNPYKDNNYLTIMTNGYTLGGQTNTQRRKLINWERGSPPHLCLVVENKMSTETQGILLAFPEK